MTKTLSTTTKVVLSALVAMSVMLVAGSTASVSAQHNNNNNDRVDICRWSRHSDMWKFENNVRENDLDEYPGYFLYEGPREVSDRQKDAWCNDQRTVTPEEPTFVDPSCDNDGMGSFTVPEQTGVVYTVDDEVVAGTVPAEYGDVVVVVANADEGWFLAKTDSEYGWNWGHEFPSEEECEVAVVEEEDDGEVLAVTTPQVTETPTGSANAGGAGSTALVGLAASSALLGLGVATKKFLV